MVKPRKKRPRGGRSHQANYSTAIVRVPVPVLGEVQALIDAWHIENEQYLSLPVSGSWWEVLGVSPSASAEEVKEAYRRLARLYHPDTNNKRLDAGVRFTALSQAYQQYQSKSE